MMIIVIKALFNESEKEKERERAVTLINLTRDKKSAIYYLKKI